MYARDSAGVGVAGASTALKLRVPLCSPADCARLFLLGHSELFLLPCR